MGFFKKGDVVRLASSLYGYSAGAQGIVDEDESTLPWVLFVGSRIAVAETHLELVQRAAPAPDPDAPTTDRFKPGDLVRVTTPYISYQVGDELRVARCDGDDRPYCRRVSDGLSLHPFGTGLELVKSEPTEASNSQPDRALEYIKAAVIEKLGETHTTIVDYRAGYVQALRDVLEEVYGLRVVREAIRFEPVDEVA